MMNQEEFDDWCITHNLTESARAIVDQIRSSEPVRLVQGRVGNIRGRYPSLKMGKTIQFESESCELHGILTFEYGTDDPYLGGVKEYYDQPCSIRLRYKTANGRNVAAVHTPDFFGLLESGGAFFEFKPEEKLQELAKNQPGRYALGKDGRWRCPPGEEYAKQFGFRYLVISNAELSATFVRNIFFIKDYLGEDTPRVSGLCRDAILEIVRADEGISLRRLLERAEGSYISADDINTVIAKGDLYVDLFAEPLATPHRARVYSHKSAVSAKPMDRSNPFTPKARFISVKEGARIICDNRVLEIRLVGEKKIFFESDKGPVEFLHAQFEDLVRRGEIQSVPEAQASELPAESRAHEILNNASPSEQAEARRRKKILDCLLEGEEPPEEIPTRTITRWKAAQRTGERVYANPLVGLLPRFSERGDSKTEKIPPVAKEIMLKLLADEYETFVQKSLIAVYGMIKVACERASVTCPSYQTVSCYKNRLPQYQLALKRKGRRAAYDKKPFYFRLQVNTPRHGDRPFEICHIDHTLIDIELVDPDTGENYGRPWATFLVDAFSRRILAIYLTFEEPSYRSCMMVLRECVRRFNRLPQTIVVDGGSEFRSQYFEMLMAAIEITVKTRPAAQPRFGGVIERLFNTAHKELIHNLIGNTQITRNVRQTTKENNPQRLAVWSMARLYDAFCDWAYDRYDIERHWTLKRSPRDVYAANLKLTGERKHRLIAYDDHFMKLTLPSTPKGTAMYVAGRGFKLNGEYYRYVGDEVEEDDLHRTQLKVRYEPFNLRYGYIYHDNRWLECITYKHPELEGRTEREQKIMSTEKKHLNRLISRELPERARKRALDIMSAEASQNDQSRNLNLIRKQKSQNRFVLDRIAGDLKISGAEPQRHSARIVPVVSNEAKAERSPSSPFGGIDVSNLGRLKELA